jgi:FKBP-type peptidyl-prolyl cis-trans isomerase
VSQRNRTNRHGGDPDWSQMTKSERRAAAKAAAAAAAAAARRRRILAITLAGLAVVAVIVAAVLYFGRTDRSGQSGTASPSGAPTATGTGFPPLPAGADPALATKPTVTAGSGQLTKLAVTTLVEGTGPAARSGQSITVNYVGVSYATGAEFDASWRRSQPFSFQLGTGNVIKGWDQGLVGVKVGSRVQLDIPSDLAYGDNPGGGRPGGPLRFVVDVLAVS